MPTRFIQRRSTLGANDRSLANANAIFIDSDDDQLKFTTGTTGTTTVDIVTESQTQTLTNKTFTSPTITNPSVTGVTPVAYTAGTSLSLTQALHANRVVFVTDVASAYVLPAATGTGDKYTIALGATQTGAGTIKVADATDVMNGTAVLFQDAGDAVVGFNTAADSDTVDLLGTSNSTGGIIGAIYEFWDVATDKWQVRIVSDAGGTEATPFSATV